MSDEYVFFSHEMLLVLGIRDVVQSSRWGLSAGRVTTVVSDDIGERLKFVIVLMDFKAFETSQI